MGDKAVFIDRDNTIIDDPGYLSDPSDVKLLPGVAGALRRLAEADYKLICVTNQSGIARGMLTEETLEAIHGELSRQLGEQGAFIDAFYHCPYHPEGTVPRYAKESDHRKPAPGMLLAASAELELDLDASWMVGDRPRDIEAGQRAGCRTVRVLTGRDEEVAADDEVEADYTVANFVEAARVILSGGAVGGRLATPTRAQEPVEEEPDDEDWQDDVDNADEVDAEEAEADDLPAAPARRVTGSMTDSEILYELLRHARQLTRIRQQSEFSITKLFAGIFQGAALLAFAVGLFKFLAVNAPRQDYDNFWLAVGWLAVAAVVQLVALTFFMMGRDD